jgi:hypothetical protein
VPSHPARLGDLFLDRSLGRVQVPRLLRAAGLRLHTLAEVYGVPVDESVPDTDWLARAGRNGWPVLMKDERIRYRDTERATLVAYRVQAFCLTSGNLRAAAMADAYIAAIAEIASACSEPGPFLYAVSLGGRLRRIDVET